MNIKGQGHSLTVDQGHSDSTFSNFFSWETGRQIEAKFHVDDPLDGGMKVYSNGSGHMTKMAAMPIYGKKYEKFFCSVTKRLMALKVDLQHRVLEYYMYHVHSDDESGLTLTYFMASLNFGPYAFVWEEGKIMDFSETIAVYGMKVGRCSQLHEYMKLISTKGQGHSLTLVQVSQI